MAQTRITHDTGTTIKPGPMVIAPPDRIVLDDDFAGMAEGSGLNTGFLADVLSAAAAHENMGINLFRVLGSMTNNPLLQPMYAQFRGEAAQSVEVYEQLITRLGGRLGYISPAARMTEGMDTKMIESFQGSGSADMLTIELKGVEAVLQAASMCVANAGLVQAVARAMPEGDDRAAVDEAATALMEPAERHLEWAITTQQTLVATQLSSKAVQTVAGVAEEVVGKIKGAFKR